MKNECKQSVTPTVDNSSSGCEQKELTKLSCVTVDKDYPKFGIKKGVHTLQDLCDAIHERI